MLMEAHMTERPGKVYRIHFEVLPQAAALGLAR